MRTVTLLLLAALSLGAQTQPKFDVASIKPDRGIIAAPVHEPTRLSLRHLIIMDLLVQAYGIQQWQLEWRAPLGEHIWYDVDAKWSDPALQDKWPEMLQALLIERFSLVLHMEQRPALLYTLSIDPKKRELLAKCQAAPEDVGKRRIDHPRINLGEEAVHFTGEDMNTIWQAIGFGVAKNRIVRETGIDGSYTLSVDQPLGSYEDRLDAARVSLSRCGLVIGRVEKTVPYLVVTSAGSLIPN